jgi:hypothetical protein
MLRYLKGAIQKSGQKKVLPLNYLEAGLVKRRFHGIRDLSYFYSNLKNYKL